MTKAAEIIAALQAARPAPVLERHTGMPYGWGLWLRTLKERLGAIRVESADAIVHLLARRPVPALPPRPLALNRWQAFRAMFYQDWDPPLREDRWLRRFAGSLSILLHLLFVLLLVFLAVIKVPPQPAAEEESRVQVEFIGEGTPQEEGGGPPAPAAASAAAAQASATPSSSTAAQASPQASALPQQDVPAPAPPVAQQTLQVTETPVATSIFVLPPATARSPEIAPPQIRPREISVPVREVSVVDVPPAQRELPQREIAVPRVAPDTPMVQEREIPSPVPQIRTMQVPTRAIAAPALQAPTPSVRQAEIASPSPGTAASGSDSKATSATTSGDSASAPSARQGTQPNATGSGSSATANRLGATPTPRRGDDWGASTRNSPGQADGSDGNGPGLFNADGSVRVPDNLTGNASKPGAPGSKQAQRADADRASKWLDRPDFPYEPTMFDKYWRPTNESLLGEWVRRAIQEVEIPIPGTSKRVKCVVSVLQAGGACNLFDPNLNEQPATARPPPEIPVKRNPIPTDS
ncbi:MAG: hypothetical protein ABI538_11720 [Pseudoxanthomonas sp.]